jgi:CheY-like chemotaxis protein
LGDEIEFEISASENLPPIFVDIHELQNAILNICLNSRAAMSEGGYLTLNWKTTELESDLLKESGTIAAGRYVELTITDTGEGMDPSILEHAFDPFFTTREVGKGTGMGLSMVYGFARQSGGMASISSTPGKGTSVVLTLPVASTDESQPLRLTESADKPVRQKATILLVEDDNDVREVTRSLLELLGYSIIEASSGEGALKVLATEKNIDIVFSDVVMPGTVSGFDLARKIELSGNGPKVLLASGYPDKLKEIHSDLDGTIKILAKPFDIGEIKRVLQEILAK